MAMVVGDLDRFKGEAPSGESPADALREAGLTYHVVSGELSGSEDIIPGRNTVRGLLS